MFAFSEKLWYTNQRNGRITALYRRIIAAQLFPVRRWQGGAFHETPEREAAKGAARLVEEAGAKVSGIGIVIEKSFQLGREILEEKGYDICSLARISKLDKDVIEFIEE